MKRVRLAALGWRHAAWRGDFYPDDLPDEWRLDYYANEFRAAVIPSEDWLAESPAEIGQWREAAGDFAFYLALPAEPLTATSHNALDAAALALGDTLKGAILPIGAPRDPAVARDWYRAASAIAPVCPLSVAPLTLADARAILPHTPGCATNEAGEVVCDAAPFAVSALPPGRSPPELRMRIEALARATPAQADGLLLFGGEPPDIENLRQARTIVDLLGI